jgi:hypothetical protein
LTAGAFILGAGVLVFLVGLARNFRHQSSGAPSRTNLGGRDVSDRTEEASSSLRQLRPLTRTSGSRTRSSRRRRRRASAG